jgi:hypothetical protein
MKKLSDFKGDQGIAVAAEVFGLILEIVSDPKNAAHEGDTPFAMFTAFMKNAPGKMRQIFAVLSEADPATYDCDGAEAMMNMAILANDPIMVQLFMSQGQRAAANASGSAVANTAAHRA